MERNDWWCVPCLLPKVKNSEEEAGKPRREEVDHRRDTCYYATNQGVWGKKTKKSGDPSHEKKNKGFREERKTMNWNEGDFRGGLSCAGALQLERMWTLEEECINTKNVYVFSSM